MARGAAAEEQLALTCTAHRAVRFVKHDPSQVYTYGLVGRTIRFVGIAVLLGAMFYNLGWEVADCVVCMMIMMVNPC